MITSIEVDGFRSLRDFSLVLRPGLNILVGPNGSGKTNIISFLDFVSRFATSDLPSAISNAGGAAAVFSREQQKDRTLSFVLRGVAPYHKINLKDNTTEQLGVLAYNYSCKLRVIQEVSATVVVEERLTVSELLQQTTLESPTMGFDLTVTRNPLALEEAAKVQVEVSETFLALRRWAHGRKYQKDDIGPLIESELAKAPAYTSIMNTDLGTAADALYVIRNDLFRGVVFNVDPSAAKEPDDFAQPPGVRKNGAGLAVTLHAAKTRLHHSQPRWIFGYSPDQPTNLNEQVFSQIQDLFRLIYDPNVTLGVQANFDLGKYIGEVEIGKGRGKVSIPLSSLSDGAVKWLALVTALLTGSPILAVEEPENFLHPTMQREIVRLMREVVDSAHLPRPLLVSTHSETLLNSCDPDEIIVATYEDQRTICRRVHDAHQLRAEIERSGFGLGFFYVSDGLT